MQTPRRDIRNAVAANLLTGVGLDVLEKAIESLLTAELKSGTINLPRIAELGRIGGDVLRLKSEEAK